MEHASGNRTVHAERSAKTGERMRTGDLIKRLVLLIMLCGASLAGAQINSGIQAITVTANLPESLTVSLSANAVSFNLTAGNAANAGSINITATTSWVLKPSRGSVGVYAYFASAAAALTDGGSPANNIPSSAFFISDNGGASTALTATTPFGGANAGLQLANVSITAANRNSSRTDAMTFNINLTSLPQLPAGSYTGTLNIQAQAN
jgi:hypothetical protein